MSAVGAVSHSGAVGTSYRELPLWPLRIALVGLPVFWVLGASWATWPFAAIFMIAAMAAVHRVKLPPGFSLWLLFLGAAVLGLAQLQNTTGAATWIYNVGSYFAVTVAMLFAFNLKLNLLERVAKTMAAFWVIVIVFGLLGVLIPDFSLKTPLAYLMPESLLNNSLVRQTTTIRFASQGNFLNVPRPLAPFAYANRWGLAVLITLPAAIYTAARSRGGARILWFILLALSLIPIVFSLNRGLWIGIALLVIYMAGRAMRRGYAKQVLGAFLGMILVGAIVLLSDLGRVVIGKIQSDYTTNARLEIYTATIRGFVEAPILGHGTTGSSLGETVGNISVGTQGQLWVVLYSWGLLAAVPFMLWLCAAFPLSRGATSGLGLVFRLPLLVAIPMTLIYQFVPDGMAVLAVCYGAAMALGLASRAEATTRDQQRRHRRRARRTGRSPARSA